MDRDDDARWDELVGGLAERIPELAAAFVDRVMRFEYYREHILSEAELHSTASGVLGMLIHSLQEGDVSEQLVRHAHQLGRDRARRGLPAAALMSAVRLDFAVLWAELVAMSAPGDATMLVGRAERVWAVVDQFAFYTQDGYLEESTRMAREESTNRQGFVSLLFSPTGHLPEAQERIARALGVARSADFCVAAVQGEASDTLRDIAEEFTGHVFIHQTGTATVAFWQAAPEEAGRIRRDPMPRVRTLPCGLVEKVSTLGGVPAAAVSAVALSEVADPAVSTPVTVTAGWPAIARRYLLAAGIDLSEPVTEALAQCREDERTRLVETVACYLRTGSVASTADELYCHRNTILNRLRRFSELTGMDLAVPRDSARLVLIWS